MPEVHLPHLDEEAESSPPATPPAAAKRHFNGWKLLLEVALISSGVFLGLMGEQWREHSHHQEQAETALQRLRTELTANREAIAKVQQYHADKLTELNTYLGADAEERKKLHLNLQGVQVAFFEKTAWEMTLATGTLNYIDSDLSFELSRIYTLQQSLSNLSSGLSQAMYIHPPAGNMEGFLGSVAVYYADVTYMEPRLLEAYDTILPKLDKALGTAAATPTATH